MDIRKLLVIIFFFLTIVIVVSLAPNIQTANTTAYAAWGAATENASMLGLSVIMPFGDVLMIISIMVAAGLLSMKMKGGASIADVLKPIGVVIAVIIALNFFVTVITSFNTLIAGAAGFGQIFYGIIPLFIYMIIVALPGGYEAYEYVKGKKDKKGKAGGGAITQV